MKLTEALVTAWPFSVAIGSLLRSKYSRPGIMSIHLNRELTLSDNSEVIASDALIAKFGANTM